MKLEGKFDNEIFVRANQSIAQGALTNSKRPSSFVFGEYPTHASKGYGAFIIDSKGNRIVDYICGLGVHLYGYGNDRLLQALTAAYRNGSVLSLSSTLEIDYAERIKSLFHMELIKIFKTSSEACHASLRVARAFNKKTIVLSEGYHGWHEEYTSLTPPAIGCVNEFSIEKFHSLEQLNNPNVSAIIVEPIITDFSQQRFDFLFKIRDICNQNGIVLIFDETITGCRFPKLSVSKFLGIDPDLMILGKAIGGGMPIAILGGRKEIMNCDDYFTSSTFSGDRTAMMTSLTLLDMLIKDGIDNLWLKGEQFINQFNALDDDVKIEGYPSRGVFKGTPERKALFFQEAINGNILFGPSWFFSYPAIEHTHSVINTCKDIFHRIQTGQVRLRGKIPQSPLSMRVRE